MTCVYNLREEWLTAAVQECSQRFLDAGHEVPESVKVSCGFPMGSRGSKKILGQTVPPSASTGGYHEVFINPILDEPLTVLGVTMRQLCQVVAGPDAGFGPAFKRVARDVGMDGRAAEATPGDALRQWLRESVLPVLGDYPHAAIDLDKREKQSTRMVKLTCPVSRYTVRTTAKHVKTGTPLSPAAFKAAIAMVTGLMGDDLDHAVTELNKTLAMKA